MIDSISEAAGGFGEKPSCYRLPPHSPEAEQGVLGCILLDTQCLGLCLEKIKDGAEVFYDLRHQTVYEHLVKMSEAGDVVDVIVLQQRLKDAGVLEQIGHIAYLNRKSRRIFWFVVHKLFSRTHADNRHISSLLSL